MKSKKWIKIFLILSFLSFVLLSTVNYVVDPFKVFNSNFLKEEFQTNERFIKIEYLEENKNNFNSYMFGSSRIGTTHPSMVEKYIKDSIFYNFTLSSANLYDYEMHLKYFISNKYPVENLYLQLDIDHMESYGRIRSDYLRKLHPYVLGESLSLYYMQYLNGYFPFNIKGKIKKNIKNENRTDYFVETGLWTKPDKEKAMLLNCQEVVSKEPSLNQSNKRKTKFVNIDRTIQSLKNIKKLADDNNINLYVFTTPHNYNMMDQFKTKYYLDYLFKISQITDFYNFSGYNTITLDNCNYYEDSHYRPHVAPLIAARIFNDKSILVPEDFGVLVTKENINEYLEKEESIINQYDISKNR